MTLDAIAPLAYMPKVLLHPNPYLVFASKTGLTLFSLFVFL